VLILVLFEGESEKIRNFVKVTRTKIIKLPNENQVKFEYVLDRIKKAKVKGIFYYEEGGEEKWKNI